MPTPDATLGGGARSGRSARERLLDAADELFNAESVQTVGIDRIIARAGVAKASLYTNFGSKEALVRAYLESRRAGTTAQLAIAVKTHNDPRARLLAIFDAQARSFTSHDFHGCAFVNASAGAPPDGLVERTTQSYRGDIRSMFRALAIDLGVDNPEVLAAQLHLIFDGAALAAQMDHNPAIAAPARAAAKALIETAMASSARRVNPPHHRRQARYDELGEDGKPAPSPPSSAALAPLARVTQPRREVHVPRIGPDKDDVPHDD
jgi:AcrR family transcriptional regulator